MRPDIKAPAFSLLFTDETAPLWLLFLVRLNDLRCVSAR